MRQRRRGGLTRGFGDLFFARRFGRRKAEWRGESGVGSGRRRPSTRKKGIYMEGRWGKLISIAGISKKTPKPVMVTKTRKKCTQMTGKITVLDPTLGGPGGFAATLWPVAGIALDRGGIRSEWAKLMPVADADAPVGTGLASFIALSALRHLFTRGTCSLKTITLHLANCS